MSGANTTVYDIEEAAKYAQLSLKGEGTIYLSFRDIEQVISKQFPHRSITSLKAIDYGCGAGRSSRYLKSLGIKDVEGFDISKEMVQQAQGFDPEGKYQLTPSASLSIPNAYYDIAFMSFVTVAIDEREEMDRVFKELSRVLKIGGILVSVTLSEIFWNPKRQWISYQQDYPENYSPKSGQKSRLKINSVNLELTDSYWKESDIVDCANHAQLSLVEMHHPLGKKEDGINWKDEVKFSPYTIFTFKKR